MGVCKVNSVSTALVVKFCGIKRGRRKEVEKKRDRRKEIRERILGKGQQNRGKQTGKKERAIPRRMIYLPAIGGIENQLKKVAYRSPVECG